MGSRKHEPDVKRIEQLNSLPSAEFEERFWQQDAIEKVRNELEQCTGLPLAASLVFSQALKQEYRTAQATCLALVEKTSAADYDGSEKKWSPAKKRKEMLLPDMRYFIIHSDRIEDCTQSPQGHRLSSNSTVEGFVSFMFTYEDGIEVVYIYEIHLSPALRSQGVGKLLMELVEGIGRKGAVSKCMLTVFKSNKKAMKWYEHLGYVIDDYSPGPRVLRNGAVKEATYLIMSKDLRTTGKEN